MLKLIKKADIILFFLLIALSIGLTVASFAVSGQGGSQVLVTVEGKEFGTYDLNRDQTVDIKSGDHINRIIIEDGTVRMVEANCHNHVCIQQGKISRVNETIICLPNRLMVRITGEEAEVDAVSG